METDGDTVVVVVVAENVASAAQTNPKELKSNGDTVVVVVAAENVAGAVKTNPKELKRGGDTVVVVKDKDVPCDSQTKPKELKSDGDAVVVVIAAENVAGGVHAKPTLV